MVFHLFGPHFRVPIKNHENTIIKGRIHEKGPTITRQIMSIYMFANNLLWFTYETLVHSAGLPRLKNWPRPDVRFSDGSIYTTVRNISHHELFYHMSYSSYKTITSKYSKYGQTIYFLKIDSWG
jgi:hypothetical protein